MVSYRIAQVLVCLWVIGMAGTEVKVNLSPDCKEFLYMGTPPQGLHARSFQTICQYYKGQPRYFTLYDTSSRVPVYSAYTFKRSDGSKKVDVPWMYEPQLSVVSGSRDMQLFPEEDIHRSFQDTQAVLDDYSDTVNYERGQLNPDEHQADHDDKAATYTLTNVVPQVHDFSVGPWRDHSHTIRRRLNNYCYGHAYVVTGVTVSGLRILRRNIRRVAVPAHLWSAYCCVHFDHNAPYEERAKFPAFASYARNQKENNEVQEMTVQEIEDFLKRVTYVSKSFQIFYDNCAPSKDTLQFPLRMITK